MKRRLLEHLACPVCGGDLAVIARSDDGGDDIREGTLHCGCGAEFPIRKGIARFASAGEALDATRRTRRMYNFTWRHFGEREVKDQWEKDSYHYASFIPPGLIGGSGRVGLDAGCGGGADLRRIGTTGAAVVGFDLSDGVEVARRLTEDVAGVEVVQGDLHAPPFKPERFDFIYSFGVLHHLPDPQAAFVRLAKLLKPGGPLVTYLYEDRAERSPIDRHLLAAVRVMRRGTSRLPPALLLAFCWAMVPLIWLVFAVPARLLRWRPGPQARRMPFSHTVKWRALAADLFDRFAPAVEFRYSERDVRELYERAGFERIETRPYRGWVSWGFRSARPS